MVLTDYLNALRRGWPIILGAVVIGVLVSSIATLRAPLEFNSDSSVLISAVGSGSPQDRQAGDSFASARAETYAALATTEEVLQPAASQLAGTTWQELRPRITAVVQTGTSVIQLRAVDTGSAAAAAEAEAVTNALVTRIETIEAAPSNTDSPGRGLFEVRVIEQPQPAEVALFPQPRNNLAAGLVGGLVVGIIVALIRGSVVEVVADGRALPRRGLTFDFTIGSRRGGKAARRRRRADLLVAVLGRRIGPAWSVLIVAASPNANPMQVADVLGAAAGSRGPTLVVRISRAQADAARDSVTAGIQPGGSLGPDLLELAGGDVDRLAGEWAALIKPYQNVLVACASQIPAADLAALIGITDMVIVAAVRNSTRVADLRWTTEDLESLGSDQVLTLLDER